MNELVELISNNFSVIEKHLTDILKILACLGIVVDVTPWIKINPIRAVLKIISNLVSRYLENIIKNCTNDIRQSLKEQDEKISNLDKRFEEKCTEDLMDKIDTIRWTILDFGNAITKRDYDKEAYDHIIELHDWYKKTIDEKQIPNGRMDITYAFIEKKYNEEFNTIE